MRSNYGRMGILGVAALATVTGCTRLSYNGEDSSNGLLAGGTMAGGTGGGGTGLVGSRKENPPIEYNNAAQFNTRSDGNGGQTGNGGQRINDAGAVK